MNSPKGRPRVLIVEDTATVLDVLRDSLTRLGYHVVTASNADEAVSRFRGRAVDLLITDLSMPGVSGWGLITALMARMPFTRVELRDALQEALTSFRRP